MHLECPQRSTKITSSNLRVVSTFIVTCRRLLLGGEKHVQNLPETLQIPQRQADYHREQEARVVR